LVAVAGLVEVLDRGLPRLPPLVDVDEQSGQCRRRVVGLAALVVCGR
jgi:site-specific recombinase